MRTWTPEAKKAQAEAIRRWQPWKNSTGPKTEVGKSRCRMNAEKHGRYNAGDIARRREMHEILAAQQAFLKSVRQILRLRKYLKTQERTIMTQALIEQGQAVVKRMDARSVTFLRPSSRAQPRDLTRSKFDKIPRPPKIMARDDRSCRHACLYHDFSRIRKHHESAPEQLYRH